jgi:phosphocarrier protein FPr
MIEVPAAAALADEFAAEVDFFSLGTNDLTQYCLAAERDNPSVAALVDPFQPAVLRLIGQAAAAAARRGRPVSVCGEMAADPLAIPLLVALGIDQLSMAPAAIPAAKPAIRALDARALEPLAARALAAESAATARAILGEIEKTSSNP